MNATELDALELRGVKIPMKVLDFLTRVALISLLVAILLATLLAVARIFWDLPSLFRGDVVQNIKRVAISVVAIPFLP